MKMMSLETTLALCFVIPSSL